MPENAKPRWSNDDWIAEHPDHEKVVCKDCCFRAEDRHFNSGSVIYGCTLAMCQVFDRKPDGILEGEKCSYYVSDKEDEDE